MAVDVGNVRTRRALLAGAVGGVAALVAHALGRPSPVLGADVELGGVNSTTATTTIQNIVDDDTVLRLQSSEGLALSGTGWSGALFRGRNRPGVTAAQISNLSLFRVPNVRAGVVGFGEDIGVRGSSANKVGVLGYAGGDGPSNMPPNAGVYGWSTTEGVGVSYGVLGRSTAPVGYGVFGTSNTGTGVQGFTKDGTAVSATVQSGGDGLRVGRVRPGPVQHLRPGHDPGRR